jgi:hypothetical protein
MANCEWANLGLTPEHHEERPVIQRKTQTESYWQEQVAVSRQDLDYLYDRILDAAKPVPIAVLAQLLIDRHCRREEEMIQAELSKGPAYQPKDHYEVGAQLIFPAFDYVLGTVVGTRSGRNPEHGDFTAIQVRFEGQAGFLEFAADLQGEHRLNRKEGEDELLVAGDLIPSTELHERYGAFVERKLVVALEEQDSFVCHKDQWFLRDMLAKVHMGHLNIVEALIDVKGTPLLTADLLPELGLPIEVPSDIQILSLNCALDDDERFDNVGDSGRDIWYLRRLTPEPVANPPARLVIKAVPYDRQEIDQELLLIEREIDDEGSGEEVMGPSRPIYKTSVTLIYPHWRIGTLPLTVRTRGLFPQATTHHTPVVLIDGQSGDKMQGWVVHKEQYVYGLKEWYQRYELPAGALVKLERTRDPRIITIDFEARRLKRLWLKVASVEEGKLVFQMSKLPVSCEYDEQMAMSEEDPGAVDRLRARMEARDESLFQLMVQIMPELIKLSPQGTVHAKAIYSGVNILRRTPPGPIFALLSVKPCFIPMGGGYWTFDATLVKS